MEAFAVSTYLWKSAIWDDTHKQHGGTGPIQTGEQHIVVIVVDGVEFRSWLPKSRAEASKMNEVAAKIVARCGAVPQIVLE